MDDVALGNAVEERFLILCKKYLRNKGEELPIPTDLNSDFLLWREMRVRHSRGDFRAYRDEILSTRKIANWTLKVNSELCNQEYQPIEFGG